ncbi:hypothetical protein SEA_VANLEE_129 [Gordonia phage VanLee]|uniref:Uncharacterized protein n=1 Tax=Gordonia phage VanLee TaxID=2845816 RepID=A0A8F2D9I9_9CAUD|nr:hypothetical protein QEH49_gp161 [Gordonia phage VanLee]QWS68245.1 hypothetical protein SEA_VANLEE_129 [Gordonia phage VanLee]
MTDTRPGDGDADHLKRYWAFDPEGRAKWAASPKPWTTLNKLLRAKKVPERMVDGLTTNIMKLAGVTMHGSGSGRVYSGLNKLKPEHKAALRTAILRSRKGKNA